MSSDDEQKKTNNNRKKDDDKPVFSQYSQVRFDIYDIVHRYTEFYSWMLGLQDQNKVNNKEYRTYKSSALSLAVQFYLKTFHAFPETIKAIRDKDRALKRFDEHGNDVTEAYLQQYGDLVDNYAELMNRVRNGVPVEDKNKKLKYEGFSPNLHHLSLISDFMSLFMSESGLSHIEGRYQDEQGNMFSYGG